ncbi:unnamed protein product [Closterium sp. NIES-65]|nr:unnamed protein product [Closterium sp. NIES-65]
MWPGLALKAPGGARGAPMQGLSQLMGLAGSHASHTHEGQPDSPHSSSASEESTDSDSDSDPASLDPTHFPYHRLDDAPDPALPHSPPAHPSLASAPCAASSASNGSVPVGEVGSAAGAGVSGETAGVASEAAGKDKERKEKEEVSEADEDFGPDRTDSDTREGVHLHPFDHGGADEARADMDGMERLFLQVASVRSSLQNAPDAVRRDTAARLAMQIAQMLGGDDDDAWGHLSRQASGPAQEGGGEGEGGAMGGSEGKGGEGGRGRVVCVTCGARREQLYRVHSPGSIEVLKCCAPLPLVRPPSLWCGPARLDHGASPPPPPWCGPFPMMPSTSHSRGAPPSPSPVPCAPASPTHAPPALSPVRNICPPTHPPLLSPSTIPTSATGRAALKAPGALQALLCRHANHLLFRPHLTVISLTIPLCPNSSRMRLLCAQQRPLCLATALILLCHATLLVFRAAHGITVDPAHLLSLPIIAQVLPPPGTASPCAASPRYCLPHVLPPPGAASFSGARLRCCLKPSVQLCLSHNAYGVAVSLLSKLLFLALVFFSLPAARHLLSWLPAIGPPQAASSQKKPHRYRDLCLSACFPACGPTLSSPPVLLSLIPPSTFPHPSIHFPSSLHPLSLIPPSTFPHPSIHFPSSLHPLSLIPPSTFPCFIHFLPLSWICASSTFILLHPLSVILLSLPSPHPHPSVPFPVVFYSLLLSSPPECLALPLLIWKYEWGMLFLSVQVLLFVSHIASLQAVSFIPWPAAAASIACGHMAIHAFEARACAMLAQSYWMAGRAGRDKGALRAMMREMAQKTEKRIDSPLVRCGTAHGGVVRDGEGQ